MPAVPPPCDREVFTQGRPVFVTNTISSQDIEEWVKKVAAQSGQKVDWHFAGGRAVVLALGDLSKVHQALVDLKAEHDDIWAKAAEQYLGHDSNAQPPHGFVCLTDYTQTVEVTRSRFDHIG